MTDAPQDHGRVTEKVDGGFRTLWPIDAQAYDRTMYCELRAISPLPDATASELRVGEMLDEDGSWKV